MKTLPAVFASLALLCAMTQSRAADPARYSSQTLDPKDIEATLVLEKDTILLGEPIFVTFTLHNKSKRDLEVNVGDEFYFNDPVNPREYFKFTITDSNGVAVRQIPGHGPGISIFGGEFPCKFNAGGEYSVPLFLPVRVVFDKPGDYTITVTKTVVFSLPPASKNEWIGKTILTSDFSATTVLKVLPADPEKLAHLMDDLGEKTIAYGKSTTNDEATSKDIEDDWYHGGVKVGDWSAAVKFMEFQDERMIPALLRAVVESTHYGVRKGALAKLASFNSDRAFEALKTAMAVPADKVVDAQIGSTAPNRPKPSPVSTYRSEVIGAIANSKHPDAIAYALTFRHDPDREVRWRVELMAELRMKPEEALPVLLEFRKDSDKEISNYCKDGIYRACEQVKPEEAIPILRDLAKDSDKQLSKAAKEALADAQKKLAEQRSQPK